MGLALAFSVPTSLHTHVWPRSQVLIPPILSIHSQVPPTIRCNGGSKTSNEKIVRRSANYKPPIWDENFIKSLNSKYVGNTYVTRVTKLKEDVKKILKKTVGSLDELEMIDGLQRLGVSYHFEDEIKRVLENIHKNKHDGNEDDLYAISLKFRLLRQHGYNVPKEVFDKFMDETGHFKASLCEDIRGILCLYEASFLSYSDESILEEAKCFAIKNLEQYLKRKDIDQDLSLLISHALERPLHWRMPRLEARWFIDLFERRPYVNPTLLQLAKLDFNMVQATHQEELKHLSWWWNKTGLGQKCSFFRNRLMEHFVFAAAENYKPELSNFRRRMTILNVLAVVLDDVYDVYGTLDELESFTNAVQRWDIGAIEQLPDYMKICFLAIFNWTNELGYEILMEHDVHIIPHLQKAWADFCGGYLKEAKWYYSRYTPTFEEYMDNGWISIGAPLWLTHAYFAFTNPINMKDVDWLVKCPNIVKWAGTIYRLADDLGSSEDEMKVGDTPKSIHCYMHETGVSEKDARDHIKYLIGKMWEKLNEEQFADARISQALVEMLIDTTRFSLIFYQNGDAYTRQSPENKDLIVSLMINPIPLDE